MRLGTIGLLVVTCAIACRTTTEPLVPLAVTVEPSLVTPLVGDTVSFVVRATGNNLVGVVIDYGDSVSDQFGMGGARTARVTFKHVFGTRGTFMVLTIVTDAVAGDKEVSVGITVN